MATTSESIGRILDGDAWLSTMDDDRRIALVAAAKRRRVEAGHCVYRIGDPPEGLYRVIAGEIRLISYPEPGRQLINLVVRPGRWFGELSTLDHGPRPHDAYAATQTDLVQVTMADITNVASRSPMLYRDIALLSCRHQRSALNYIGVTVTRSAGSRLAQVLAGMVEPHKVEGPAACPAVEISQEDLAGRVGLSRQTLSRLLRAAQNAGLLQRAYRKIIIIDRAGLHAWEGAPPTPHKPKRPT